MEAERVLSPFGGVLKFLVLLKNSAVHPMLEGVGFLAQFL
jgi:hypothetical protein